MRFSFTPLAIAALAVPLATAAPLQALAHAKLTASTPKDGSTVAVGLSELELAFSAPLRVTAVHLRDAAEHDVALTSELPKAFAAVLKLGIAALAPGAYKVTWTAVGEDGHVMKGAFGFSVAPGEAPAK